MAGYDFRGTLVNNRAFWTLAAMAQIYVPGLDPQDNPDAFLSTLGAGTDGFTTYVVEGGTPEFRNSSSAR